ncbi:LysR family transcriptional regulator [Falsiroseomonas oryzae]|uniref:LysR family transcriptional regulator n=1 Tax=Falsiroseomonas oryzae TaxID=2766473 RepID=UPI0022EAC14F|nr:LysR family transcriptional regulator [Roseomonas sp. MO-31]
MPARIPQPDTQDLRLLRLFASVVEHGGFTAAQIELGVSQSWISTRMAALETRLGMRLCHRGRAGFALTEDGRRVYEAAQRLLSAAEAFRADVTAAHGRLAGELRLGMVDNMINNLACRVPAALGRLRAASAEVVLSLHVAAPNELERMLVDGRLDTAIGAFHRRNPVFAYRRLFTEPQGLFCGRGHPLFDRPEGRLRPRDIEAADGVLRGYVGEPEQARGGLRLKPAAVAWHMEAVAALILSGRFVGHLPIHYAAQWVEAEQMRELMPDRLRHDATFSLVLRRGAQPSAVLRRFVEELGPAARA